MGAASCRVVPALVPVGDKEVLLTIIEEFGPGENCGVPIHVRIAGPDGLTTEGKYPEVWQEMLELLGVGKPADGDREKAAISTRHSALSQDEPAHSSQQSELCQDERPEMAIVKEGSAFVALTPPVATQNQNQTQTQTRS